MSFASEVKNELCRVPLSRHCCAVAEAYGVLLYCHTFTTREIRIVTACDAFAERPPAFSVHMATRSERPKLSATAVCSGRFRKNLRKRRTILLRR